MNFLKQTLTPTQVSNNNRSQHVDRIENVLRQYLKVYLAWRKFLRPNDWDNALDNALVKFPKPNCRYMTEYESNPSVWVIEDSEFNIQWVIYSDILRKSAFKGTSVEIIGQIKTEYDAIKICQNFADFVKPYLTIDTKFTILETKTQVAFLLQSLYLNLLKIF